MPNSIMALAMNFLRSRDTIALTTVPLNPENQISSQVLIGLITFVKSRYNSVSHTPFSNQEKRISSKAVKSPSKPHGSLSHLAIRMVARAARRPASLLAKPGIQMGSSFLSCSTKCLSTPTLRGLREPSRLFSPDDDDEEAPARCWRARRLALVCCLRTMI